LGHHNHVRAHHFENEETGLVVWYLTGGDEVLAGGVDVEADVLVGVDQAREPHHHAARVSDVPTENVVLLPCSREEVVAVRREERLPTEMIAHAVDRSVQLKQQPNEQANDTHLRHTTPMPFEHRHHAAVAFGV
jgi:hypothetical protein